MKRIIASAISLAIIATNAIGLNTYSSYINVTAADLTSGEVLKGKCGENASWLINSDGVLVISGTGEMSRYADDSSTDWGWRKYGYNINEIVVENGITVGGSNAFVPAICKYITKITLPPSLTKLNGCMNPDAGQYVNLKDIYVYSENTSDASTLYNSMYSAWSKVETVWHVYQGSDTETSLKNDLKLFDEQIQHIPNDEQMPSVSNKTPVELEPVNETSGPAGLTSKYEYSESNKTLTFSGTGAISIRDNYIKYSKQTENIIINSGITTIDASTGFNISTDINDGAFYGFTALKDVELPNTLTYIGDSSFYQTPLTNINLPSTLKSIGQVAFAYTNIEEIIFPDSLNYIGEQAFTATKIKSINLHAGMTIAGMAFHSCNSLKEVTIPKNIFFNMTTILSTGMRRPPLTFALCTGLEKVTIEDGTIIQNAFGQIQSEDGLPEGFFQECTSLKTLIIKGDVEYICSKAFASCPLLTDVYFYNTGLNTITKKGEATNNFNIIESIDTTKNPTFHVVKGSQTEQTLKDAGYLTDDNTKYIPNINELQSAIDEAEKIDTSKYSDNTLINNLKTALENANSVRNNLEATQEDVDAAVKALNDAISALNPKTPVTPTIPTGNAPIVTTTRSPEVVKKDKDAAKELMKQAKITKLKVKSKAKKKITVTWKKVSKAKGYQVQVSKKQNFKKRILNKFTTKKKLTINKKIKSGKTYFVRVRAYATYKDAFGKPQKVYSKWNKKLRKVKVK